jgi:hypothetical protein
MSSSSGSSSASSGGNVLSAAWTSTVPVIVNIRDALLLSFVVFFWLAGIVCRSKKSMFDHIAARKASRVILVLTGLEVFWIAPLIYCVGNLGSPVLVGAALTYGTGTSWVFGWGRPCMGIAFIAFGATASMHPVPRFVCMTGCALQIIFDAMSAFQVRNYIDEMDTSAAPAPPNYTRQLLLYYYWRDVSSIGVALVLLLMVAHLALVVGCCYPPLIPYRLIEGGDLDRCEVMRQQSRLRQEYDEAEWVFEQEHLSQKEDHGGGGGKKRRQGARGDARKQFLEAERQRRVSEAADVEALQHMMDHGAAAPS